MSNLYNDIMGQLSGELCSADVQSNGLRVNLNYNVYENQNQFQPQQEEIQQENTSDNFPLVFIKKYTLLGKCSSEEKQKFLQFIDSQPTDDVIYLVENMEELTPNKEFIPKLQNMIKKHCQNVISKMDNMNNNLEKISNNYPTNSQVNNIESKLNELIKEIREMKSKEQNMSNNFKSTFQNNNNGSFF